MIETLHEWCNYKLLLYSVTVLDICNGFTMIIIGRLVNCCRNLSLSQQYRSLKKFSVASCVITEVCKLCSDGRSVSLLLQKSFTTSTILKSEKVFQLHAGYHRRWGALQWWSVGHLIVAEIFHYINNINGRKNLLQDIHHWRVELCNDVCT